MARRRRTVRRRPRARGTRIYESIRSHVIPVLYQTMRHNMHGWGYRPTREDYERDRRELARLSRSIRSAEKRGDADQLAGALVEAGAIVAKWRSMGYRVEPPPVVREALEKIGFPV